MKIELTQPFRLTPFTVVSLDLAVMVGLYVIYADNYRISSAQHISPHDPHIIAWFDVVILSAFRTLFILLGLFNVRSNRPMIITVVCLVIECLLVFELVSYGLENLSLRACFYFIYPQLIGFLEILSAILPPKIELNVNANVTGSGLDEELVDEELYQYKLSRNPNEKIKNSPLSTPVTDKGLSKESNDRPSTSNDAPTSDDLSLTALYKSFSATYKRVLEMERRHEMWKHVCTKEGVEIFKCSDGPLLTIKGSGHLTVSPIAAFMIISSFDLHKKWDYLFDHGKEIVKINDTCRILHLTYKAIWPTAARDMCIMEDITVEDNGDVTIISKSVVHKDALLKPRNVRADIKCCGGFISRVPGSPEKTRVQLIAQADIGGNIPIFVANYIAVQQPMCLAVIQKFIDQNPDKIAEIEREAAVFHKSIMEKRGSLNPVGDDESGGQLSQKFSSWAERRLAEYERNAN